MGDIEAIETLIASAKNMLDQVKFGTHVGEAVDMGIVFHHNEEASKAFYNAVNGLSIAIGRAERRISDERR